MGFLRSERGRLQEVEPKAMTPDNLKVLIELEALITEREGMKACNEDRCSRGERQGYAEESFRAFADDIRALAAKVKP
jgi:hypothetical protein